MLVIRGKGGECREHVQLEEGDTLIHILLGARLLFASGQSGRSSANGLTGLERVETGLNTSDTGTSYVTEGLVSHWQSASFILSLL